MELSFDSLISPITENDFFSSYWEKRPLIIHRNNLNYYGDLLSIDDLDFVLSQTDLRNPGFRLVKNGDQLPIENYTFDSSTNNHLMHKAVDVERTLKEYRDGATIIFQAMHKYWKPLSILCRNLEKRITHRFQTNIYLTPSTSQGFLPHFDTHDVFVLQLEGTKHWTIYGQPIKLPTRGQRFDANTMEIGDVAYEFDLVPGDLIYVPRGYVHEAKTTSSHSLHITIGVIAYTWAHFLNKLLNKVVETNSELRHSLPHRFATSETNEEGWHLMVEPLFKILDDASLSKAILEGMQEEFVSTRLPILDGQLELLTNKGEIDSFTKFELRPSVIYRFRQDNEYIELSFHGKNLKFPSFVAPALRYIINSQSAFSTKQIPDCLDGPGKLVLLRRLRDEGLLKEKK